MTMKKKGNLTAYKNWAPDGVLWTEWVKPVLFADDDIYNASRNGDSDFEVNMPHIDEANSVFEVKPPPADWIGSITDRTAVILDLPGKVGVEEAMELARKGYRPVPLYNGVCNRHRNDVVVSTPEIAKALFAHANELPALNIDDDAPPAFMLDSNRLANGIKKEALFPRMFDNRWCVFPQDMPSAEFLKKHGITKVLVYSKKIDSDLEHILYRYQKQGIVIRQYDGKNPIKVIRVSKPSAFKSVFYRFKVMAGLSRNASGGFGDTIPEPSSSTGGG